MSLGDAKKALTKGFTVKGADGKDYTFGPKLVEKYEGGGGRAQGASPGRLGHLPRAILTVQKASHGVKERPNDNPPQRSMLHDLGNSRGAIVFVDAATCEVRGFIYSNKFRKLQGMHEKAQKN